MKHFIRDRDGKLLGSIDISQDRQELRDRLGYFLGEYTVKNNETRDRHGKLVGSGNLLMTLLNT